MAAKSHNPDDLNPWPELPDVLRAGVRGVRRAPVPTESLDRALDRARRLKRPKPWLLRRAPLLVSAAVAAILLIGLGSTFPFAPYLARDDHPDSPSPQSQPERVASAAPLLLGGPNVLAHAFPRDDYHTMGLPRPNSTAADWERVQGLRDMANGMPAVDRDSMERYLRQLWRQGSDDRFLVWNKDSRALDQARILTAEGELRLQSVSVEALVEGPRARTLVDHIFHNPYDKPVEAIFEFPLPDGASPSYFTLFPGNKTPQTTATNKLFPGEEPPLAATRQVGLRTPAEAMRKVDASCWGEPRIARVIPVTINLASRPEPSPPQPTSPGSAAPASSTFRGCIGTIPAKSHLRILFAYEETLPVREGKVVYEYPLPTCRLYNLSVALQTDTRQAANASLTPADASREADGSRVTFRRSWRNVTAAGTLSFQAACPDPSVQATTGRHNDAYYLLARLRPDVPTLPAAPPFARHAVFLLDTSAGEHVSRFDRCVKLMRSVLEQDPDIGRFNVLTFNSAAGWLEPKGWLANTKQGRDLALSRLDGLQLEGATDLSAALGALSTPPVGLAPKMPLHCFLLSDGKLTAGDADLPALVSRFQARFSFPARWHCYQTGLGEENAELFGLLTRAGGGVYRCPSEKDVVAAAAAHRRTCLLVKQLRIESEGRARDLFVAGRHVAVYPGGELLVTARLSKPGKAQVVLEGSIDKQAVVQRFPVEVGAEGTLAARGWGELAVGSLLALQDPRTEPLAISLARHFALPTRLTSFALLANDKGQPDPLVMPVALDVGLLADHFWSELRRTVTPHQRRDWLRDQIDGWIEPEQHRRDLRAIVDLLPEKDLLLAEAPLAAAISRRQALPSDFLAEISRNRKSIPPFLDEADRRVKASQSASAVCCLCGLLEEHPGNAEVVRLVGYQLVAIGQPGAAAGLLTDVVERTPTDAAAHRALAVALDQSGRPVRAALHYEVALAQLGERAGFAAVRDELVHLLRRTLPSGELSPRLRSHFTIRLEELDRQGPADLRISATWNTAANVELIVTGPGGKSYQAPEPEAGTIGVQMGPRRVEFAKADKGPYAIQLRLATVTPETAAATFVTVQIVRNAGTKQERVETRRVLLRKQGDQAHVARLQP